MKERPILFSAPMVRAILAGNKTMTRRVVKPPPGLEMPHEPLDQADRDDLALSCPYGQPRDRLWVRETWRTDSSLDATAPRDFCRWPVQYLADGAARTCGALYGNTHGKTRVSIHMPRWASRITLEITGVRVEQLLQLSYEDAVAEGVVRHQRRWYANDEAGRAYDVPQGAFSALWEAINGAGSWHANPWVWVVEFKRLEQPHA